MAIELLIKIANLEGQDLTVTIYELKEDTLFYDSLAHFYGESRYQLVEGRKYEYEINLDDYTLESSSLVKPSRSVKFNGGTIETGLNVGRYQVGVMHKETHCRVGILDLEIRSLKANYREDYRVMLKDITEYCTELLMDQNSEVKQSFSVDESRDQMSDYQRFAFVQSILISSSFQDAIQRVLREPQKRWKEEYTHKRVNQIRRISSREVRQLVRNQNRVPFPKSDLIGGMNSIPRYIEVSENQETTDVVENQFVKFVLEQFLSFSSSISSKNSACDRLKQEATDLNIRIQQILAHPLFTHLSQLRFMPFNSPILQRKEGYREVLQSWLMFDMASKLQWEGGDDIYSAGKKNVALLYEYWVFFKLMEAVSEAFQLKHKSIDQLITVSQDRLNLSLKQGKMLVISGQYKAPTRTLNVEFTYNKTFSSNSEYGKVGSWSRSMRPDYTLSIWPGEITSKQAEEQELMSHIHFDAKYRLERLMFRDEKSEVLSTDEQLREEKVQEDRGNYKRADLLKMHAYKDAIRRSVGAYVIYPGTESCQMNGFHEIIPGLGAFPLSSTGEDDSSSIKSFLNDVVKQLLNRTSQQEELSYHRYRVLQKESSELMERIPENVFHNRSFWSDDTYVLVGYYKDQTHFDWIVKNKLYNARTESQRGSLHLNRETVSARYLLLHGEGKQESTYLYKLDEKGPRLYSAQTLRDKGYENPHSKFYLVFSFTDNLEDELRNITFDVSYLKNYSRGRGASLPFTTKLSDLIRCKVST